MLRNIWYFCKALNHNVMVQGEDAYNVWEGVKGYILLDFDSCYDWIPSLWPGPPKNYTVTQVACLRGMFMTITFSSKQPWIWIGRSGNAKLMSMLPIILDGTVARAKQWACCSPLHIDDNSITTQKHAEPIFAIGIAVNSGTKILW